MTVKVGDSYLTVAAKQERRERIATAVFLMLPPMLAEQRITKRADEMADIAVGWADALIAKLDEEAK